MAAAPVTAGGASFRFLEDEEDGGGAEATLGEVVGGEGGGIPESTIEAAAVEGDKVPMVTG